MYETGTASDRIDLIDRIRNAAESLGWQIVRWELDTDGEPLDGWLAISRPGDGSVVYHMMPSGVSDIVMRGSTGYNPTAAWGAQPGGQSADTVTNLIAGPYHAYHIYATQDYIHVVIEAEPGRHRHLGVGVIERYGSWSGGEYVCGTYWDQGIYQDSPDAEYHACPMDALTSSSRASTLRVDIDGLGSQWRSVTRSFGAGTVHGVLRGVAADNSIMARLYHATPTTITGIAQLIPIMPLIGRVGDNTRMSPAGHVRDMRYVSMRYIQPGEIIMIGTDEWQVWPVVRRVDQVINDDATEQSGYYGIAYRRVIA